MEHLSKDSRNLDCLRAIAVLAVYVCHLLGPTLGIIQFGVFGHDLIGRAGVLFFFVHTCLVLLLSLERSPAVSWRLFANFYIRRLFRIYPLSVLAVLALVVLQIPDMPNSTYHWVGRTGLVANLGLIQNITHSPDVLGPLWSLPWEVQMYLALPALFLLLRRFRTDVVVWLLWSAAFALRFPAWHFHMKSLHLLAYYPCFLGGAIAFRMAKPERRRLNPALWPPFILLMGALFVILTQLLPYQSEAVGGYVVCALVGAAIPYFRELPEGWFAKLAHWVAKYSYGIYLSHVPIMWLIRGPLASTPAAIRWTSLAVLSIAVPIGLFHLVEDPLIGVGKRIADHLSSRAQASRSRAVLDYPPSTPAFGTLDPRGQAAGGKVL
jgi:peptidoglycan/LPS O-acetylase OafA/YrhL